MTLPCKPTVVLCPGPPSRISAPTTTKAITSSGASQRIRNPVDWPAPALAVERYLKS